jgi:hypothetical protein
MKFLLYPIDHRAISWVSMPMSGSFSTILPHFHVEKFVKQPFFSKVTGGIADSGFYDLAGCTVAADLRSEKET